MGHGVSKVPGVVVEGNEKVVVKRKQLKKVPLYMIKDSLKSFNMSHNAILSIPPQISTMQNLTELNLSHNWLNNKGIPQELNSLRCLRTLDLSHNNLTAFPDIFSLTTVHTLNICSNGYAIYYVISLLLFRVFSYCSLQLFFDRYISPLAILLSQ